MSTGGAAHRAPGQLANPLCLHALWDREGTAQRLIALSQKGEAAGFYIGQSLTSARAAMPGLRAEAVDSAADSADQQALARWAGRYCPWVSLHGSDGLILDITGSDHLFGGEQAVMDDIRARLHRAGLSTRLACADTWPAAALAARHATTAEQPTALWPPGSLIDNLTPLPINSMQEEAATLQMLNRLGLKTIGHILALPRASLARRFQSRDRLQPGLPAASFLKRLDGLVGRTALPLDPALPIPRLRVRQSFMEPVLTREPLEAALPALAQDLMHKLAETGDGLRRARLSFSRVDGSTADIGIGLSRPSRRADHLLRLILEKLDDIDAGFGIDLILLSAEEISPLAETQTEVIPHGSALTTGIDQLEATAALADRLKTRLGAGAVLRLKHYPSHAPERQQSFTSDLERPLGWEALPLSSLPPRPTTLLPRPEPIDVIADLPDGPPARFRWRRVLWRTRLAEGPERIEPEWWLALGAPKDASEPPSEPQTPDHTSPRDYYLIEEEAGRRFWLFRRGLFTHQPGLMWEGAGQRTPPRWYLHGFFA